MSNFYKGTNGFNEPPKPVITQAILPPKYLPQPKLPAKYCAPL